MATTEYLHGISPSPAEKARTLLAAAAERLAGLWTAIRNRRAAAQLLSWDGRMLGDIGLSRGDVESAFSGGVTEDPTPRLAEFRTGRRNNSRRSPRLG